MAPMGSAAWKGSSVHIRLANHVICRKGAMLRRLPWNPFIVRLYLQVGGETFKGQSTLKGLHEQPGLLEGALVTIPPFARVWKLPLWEAAILLGPQVGKVLLFPSTLFLSFNIVIIVICTLSV